MKIKNIRRTYREKISYKSTKQVLLCPMLYSMVHIELKLRISVKISQKSNIVNKGIIVGLWNWFTWYTNIMLARTFFAMNHGIEQKAIKRMIKESNLTLTKIPVLVLPARLVVKEFQTVYPLVTTWLIPLNYQSSHNKSKSITGIRIYFVIMELTVHKLDQLMKNALGLLGGLSYFEIWRGWSWAPL